MINNYNRGSSREKSSTRKQESTVKNRERSKVSVHRLIKAPSRPKLEIVKEEAKLPDA